MKHVRPILFALVCSALLATPALGAPLGTIVLEGQLRTVAGSPVPDGDYPLKISLYKDKQDPKAVHSETINSKVAGGGFLLSLGLAQALKSDIFADGSAAWIGIQVGTEAELPRLPMNHVAYAFRAEHAQVAHTLKCSGCLKTEHLDKSILADYAKSETLKGLVPVDQKCGTGEVVTGFDKDGKVQCAKDSDTTYTGKNFAVAGQTCPTGQVISKIDADGKVVCELGGKTYTGKNFALSGQVCPPNQVVASITAGGKIACKLDQKGAVSGADFALSDQNCGKGKVLRGIDKSGKAICANIAYELPVPAGSMSKTEVANLQQSKLANGKTPWDSKAAYSENGEGFFGPTDAKKPFKAQAKGGQMVLRSDSTTEYAKGVGAYPFVFMYGGNVAANRIAAFTTTGTVWTKGYGWLHTRFAAANQKCGSGHVAVGISTTGKLTCIKDANSDTKYAAGTYMKMESGNKIGANLKSFDARYLNENQANSITSAMVKDGALTGADLKDKSVTNADIADAAINSAKFAANSVLTGHIKDGQVGSADVANDSLTGTDIKNSSLTGSDIADGSLTGSDVKNESLTGSDIANSSLTGSDVKNESLTGSDIKDSTITTSDVLNGSLTGSDVKDESLTGSDIANSTLTGSDIKDSSLTGSDVANESLTGSDIKNGSLGYSDTNVNSIQRRITGTCLAGSAVTAVSNSGAVTCEKVSVSDVHERKGTCKANEWRRIATASNSCVNGMFVVRASGGTLTFNLSGCNWAGMSFSLLNHGTKVGYSPGFGAVRLLKYPSGGSDVQIRCPPQSVSLVSMAMHGNKLSAGFTPLSWLPAGSSTGEKKQWNVNYLMAAGNDAERFKVERNGNVWNSGSTTTVGASTAGGVIRSNGGFNVDGSTVIDNGAGWHRAYGKTGFISATYGGGIYMTDSTWVRVYNKKSLLVDANIYTSGSIGIGDSSPNYALDIERDTTTWLAAFENKNGNDTNVYLAHDDQGIYVKVKNTDTTTGYIAEFANHSGSAMTIEANRNVGIRDTSPSYTLDVAGTVRAVTTLITNGSVGIGDLTPNYPLDVEKSSASWLGTFQNTYGVDTVVHLAHRDSGIYVKSRMTDTTSGYIAHFRNASGHAMTIDNNRRVGINTENPGYNLEVNGTMQADAIRVGSKTLATYIRDYVNGNCYIYFGWRDSCDSCTTSPSKAGRVRPGSCQSNLGSSSTNNSCKAHTLGGNSIQMMGINTDGTVNGDDKFWIGFRCF
jgi:uncharacterized protein YjbI with pentapeptide repeats